MPTRQNEVVPPLTNARRHPMRMCRRLVLVLALLGTLVAGATRAHAAPPSPSAGDPWAYDHAPGELLVGFRGDAPFGQGATAAADFDRYLAARGVQAASPPLGDGRTYRLTFAP